MEEAIKLAIEKGGYLKSNYWWPTIQPWGVLLRGDDTDSESKIHAEIVLEHEFWQALGKALGWKEETDTYEARWYLAAQQYFHCVLTDSDTEPFWKELISSSEQEHSQPHF